MLRTTTWKPPAEVAPADVIRPRKPCPRGTRAAACRPPCACAAAGRALGDLLALDFGGKGFGRAMELADRAILERVGHEFQVATGRLQLLGQNADVRLIGGWMVNTRIPSPQMRTALRRMERTLNGERRGNMAISRVWIWIFTHAPCRNTHVMLIARNIGQVRYCYLSSQTCIAWD